ncbi:MAG: hydantoinase/oxoprolinase family protein [Gammaproteobacteria bacterium]|nr:hydantoinase/oxoprolinase family protein [Gammaproteobacteria bacterium]
MVLGVDAGGTFTDFVLLWERKGQRQLRIHKVLSTPAAPEQAILQGIRDLELNDVIKSGKLLIIHGSTVATNAVLEGKGAPTVFITNHGFADMLTLGRQTRPALFQLEFPPVPPPVASEYCLEVGGRLTANGKVLEPLLDTELEDMCTRIKELEPTAVAINLLFSFVDDRFERAIEKAVNDLGLSIFVSRSSQVLPEYKEYERGIATWLNASLGPVVGGYLNRLSEQLGSCQLMIMQSSGEVVAAKTAGRRAVSLLLSGPAAGLAAINHLGRRLQESKFLSFDMGGTSTDVALIDGELQITNEGRIANYPVAVPMVDMHTIGAGGGSIAFLDAGGMLQVGPLSAGADPGPACYGRGGTAATVTDANLVLGRIKPGVSLAGSFKLDLDAALAAIESLARASGLSVREMASGIIDVANERMAEALRMISVQRGYDPAEFTLASFGGAGGLHVCALAEAMGMRRAIVPAHGGVLSALGMLVAPRGRQFSRTVRLAGDSTNDSQLQAAFQQLLDSGTNELVREGLKQAVLKNELSIDMCYSGQSSTLNLPWNNKQNAIQEFHKLHKNRHGFSLQGDVEIVNIRVRITSKEPLPDIHEVDTHYLCNDLGEAVVYSKKEQLTFYERQSLMAGQLVVGPAIVTEPSATTFIKKGWTGKADEIGNIWLDRNPEAADIP